MDPPRLGQIFCFDTSVLGTSNEAWAELRRLAAAGDIELRRASSVGDDLARDPDPERRSRLEAEGDYPEMPGVAERLGVQPQTARVWRHRGLLPGPEWTVSRAAAWNWPDIQRWAQATGRPSDGE